MVMVCPIETSAGAMEVITGPAPVPVTVIFDLAVPDEFSTTMSCTPIVAPDGIFVVMDVEVLSVTVQPIPPIFTDDPERFLPVIMMVAPVSALDGVMLLICGPSPSVSSFEQDWLARVNINNREKENSRVFFVFFIVWYLSYQLSLNSI